MQQVAALRPKGSIIVEEAPSSRAAMHDYLPIVDRDGFYTCASGTGPQRPVPLARSLVGRLGQIPAPLPAPPMRSRVPRRPAPGDIGTITAPVIRPANLQGRRSGGLRLRRRCNSAGEAFTLLTNQAAKAMRDEEMNAEIEDFLEGHLHQRRR
jgi:hypothetical protein